MNLGSGDKQRVQAAFPPNQVLLLAFVLILLVFAVNGERETWARGRDLVATPPLMRSPLQVIESRMRLGEIQRFESRMLDSPLQLIGSPFEPFRFATLPNLQDLWATRQGIPTLPAMFLTPRGTLLMLPYYVLPLTKVYLVMRSSAVTEEPAPSLSAPRPAAKPKFFIARCGTFMEILVPPDAHLSDEESKPC